MSERVTMPVELELLSDCVFGSGHSVPGGEDVAVCTDAAGWPYLKGSTFKGLLRESLENLLCWTGGAEAELEALMGASGWNGADGGRRVHLTGLTLEDRPAAPEECFRNRMFTALENGTVKEGTLRTAACIRRGLRFSGSIHCDGADAPLLRQALAGIKWAGTMRSRGFGRVRFSGGEALREERVPPAVGAAECLRFRLRTEAPVIITDLGRSRGSSYAVRRFIPGSAVRGLVLGTLAREEPAWFAENRIPLLNVRFLDAVPVRGERPPLPALMGFYEDKGQTRLESVMVTGAFTPGYKRAKLGAFCALEEGSIHSWSAETESAARILREGEQEMFETRALSPGQEFEGYVLSDRPDLAEKIAGVLSGTVWLGADRYEGFGKCAVTALEPMEEPAWRSAYGYGAGDDVPETLYLLAVSPLSMVDAYGVPCGLREEDLSRALGVSSVEVELCSTAVAEFGGYNRTLLCREAAVGMYDRGSLFKLRCGEAPSAERLLALQRRGLGIRKSEGFGQILFLRSGLYEGIREKKTERTVPVYAAAAARRAWYQWIMDWAETVRACGLSKSQLGTLQALCEKARGAGGDDGEIHLWLERNSRERGVRHGSRFKRMERFVREVLDTPLGDTLKKSPGRTPDKPLGEIQWRGTEDSKQERLRLLCELLNFSRKGKEREG